MSKLPTQLIESLREVEGFSKESFLKVHETGEQVTSIRLNPAKQPAAVIDSPDAFIVPSANTITEVDRDDISSTGSLKAATLVPWCSLGRYLPIRPSFTFDPTFHAGAYYVQEASSMFIDHIIQQLFQERAPSRVLDLCAAPGGKSTLLASRLTNSFIISNEVIKSRVTILAENISKWGSSNVMVTHNDPKDFKKLPGYFDLMVVDAPCSGSGLFRKDINAINEWSEANVQLCHQRQQRILGDALVSLKTNGFLVYSTCSYSKEEDEDICDWIVDSLHLEPVRINVNSKWGIVETFSDEHRAPGYRFYPDKLKGEGFFVACFKQSNAVDEYFNSYRPLPSISKSEREIVAPFIYIMEQLAFIKQKETIIAFPEHFSDDMATLQKTLNVRKSGVAVGTIKGKDLVPHHELALSSLVNPDIPSVTVDYENAIRYLRRSDLITELSTKGWAVIRYNDLNLGWIKMLSNRINNYYPTDWRTLKH